MLLNTKLLSTVPTQLMYLFAPKYKQHVTSSAFPNGVHEQFSDQVKYIDLHAPLKDGNE